MGNKPSTLHERTGVTTRTEMSSSGGSGSISSRTSRWKNRLRGVTPIEPGSIAPKLEVIPAPETSENSFSGVSGASRGPSVGNGLQNQLGLSAPRLDASNNTSTASSASHLSRNSASEMSPPSTVPCQYRTGKTLGSGTYAIVKEAVHIKTGKYYACKVINKKLMEGREYMVRKQHQNLTRALDEADYERSLEPYDQVRNEIAVLKRVSKGHPNIVTLHDYFETTHNLYLCFDLCTGGELFDRICAKGNYYEADAAGLVRTIMRAVEYIHGCGIVHRDLKPENLLFRTKAEEADIMIADFGLSRIMDEDKLQLLTEICGTPGYMAPEIFKKSGHGKPVDIWAMGVITYFLLCGYTPFDRDTQEQEMQAIIAGDYKFEPEEYWANVSPTARDFVEYCLTIDPAKRPTAAEALEHRWLASETPHFVADPESPTGGPKDLLPTIQKGFNARKTFRKAVLGMMAMRRMSMMRDGHHLNVDMDKLSPRAKELATNINQYIEDAEKEEVDSDKNVVHHHGADESDDEGGKTPLTPIDTKNAPRGGSALSPPVAQMQNASLTDSK